MWPLIFILPLVIPVTLLFMPSIVPQQLFHRLAFGTIMSQIMYLIPGVNELLGQSNLVHSMAAYSIILLATFGCTSGLLQLWMFVVHSIGPLISFVSSILLIDRMIRVSRYWSLKNGESERQDEQPTMKYKILILSVVGVSYLFAIRWLYLYLTLLDHITLGHLITFVSILLIVIVLTWKCLYTRRAVLSEVAFVTCLVSYGLYQFGVANLSPADYSNWLASERSHWLLDEWMAVILDGVALVFLLVGVISYQQRINNSTGLNESSFKSLTSSIALYRVIALLLLTHYLQQHLHTDMFTAYLPWWTSFSSTVHHHFSSISSQVTKSSVGGWLASRLWSTANATASTESPTWVTALLTSLAAYFPSGLSAVSRGVTAVAYYGTRLKRDHEEQDQEQEHDD